MIKVEHAQHLAKLGFHVFPIVEGKKAPPRMEGWQRVATRDANKIADLWRSHPNDNIGIYTGKFGANEALLVLDIDNKGTKNGDGELFKLECAGLDLAATFENHTPTGGRHLVYRTSRAVKQSVDSIATGIDVRSRGGYIVGPGSTIGTLDYRAQDFNIAPAPQWIIDRCGIPRERDPVRPAGPAPESALDRAKHYLLNEAPLSLKGAGGDAVCYQVCCRVKDFGVTQDQALELMLDNWNDRCPPGWSPDKLAVKIKNAYAYGIDQPGVAAPELAFDAVKVISSGLTPIAEAKHPFDILNRDHAYVIAGDGDHIIWETTDESGRAVLKHLSIGTFHRRHGAWTINAGKRDEPVTELWMKHKRRRAYDGLVFNPEQPTDPRFYNLWRGFAVKPLPPDETPTKDAQDALDAFLEHARDNVCRGNDELYRWLIGYFAHLVQRPWEKPLVALVFRGGKGVGKNALIERIGSLLGGHFLLTSNRRYLLGNFNGHLENCLMFALDEAFWSGDKQAEGQIKDLITGSQHVIEHKGKEPFRVDNRTRIVIIGNEEWLAPASHDERRFAVFDVGDGRKQDRNYFESMRVGMERGGYRLLLRYLLGLQLGDTDVNAAPQTKGLLDQKHETLDPFKQWWLDCLQDGKLIGGDFETSWPGQVETDRFRTAFRRYVQERRINSRIPDNTTLGKTLKKICAGAHASKKRNGEGFDNTYKLPSLADCRLAWDAYIGHPVEWEQ